jgi:CBS domain containing-hemolysin-like protein
VLFGEIIPKTIGLRRGRTFALLAAPTVELLAIVLAPLRILVERLTTMLTPAAKEFPLDLAQLRTLVKASRDAHEITPFEAKVLQRTLSFGELTVERLLTPRVDLASVEADATLSEAARVCRATGRNRLVVTEGGIDNVVGVLLLKDLLPRRARLDEFDVRSTMREPIFVPETLPAAKLFEQLQRSRMHLAVVVGEHGGVEGIATLEDVLEELIGDIRDESDLPISELEEMEDGVWQADARIELDDLNDATGLALEQESDSVTLSGWLEDQLGRIPRAGDVVDVEGFSLRVLTARPTRAHLVRVVQAEASV